MSDMERMKDTVSQHATALGGASIGEVAQEWIDAGFSREAADAWMSVARCFDADSAAALRDAGVTPEQASAEHEGGETIGHAVAHGDLSARKAAKLVR